jgi:hypothetical protein
VPISVKCFDGMKKLALRCRNGKKEDVNYLHYFNDYFRSVEGNPLLLKEIPHTTVLSVLFLEK